MLLGNRCLVRLRVREVLLKSTEYDDLASGDQQPVGGKCILQ